MTKALSTGQKTLRANIRAQKAIGRANAKLRAKTVAANVAEHQARNEDRRILAIIDQRDRMAAGIAKRDAHNAALKAAAATKVEAYELAFSRPAARGDGYGVILNDNEGAQKLAA